MLTGEKFRDDSKCHSWDGVYIQKIGDYSSFWKGMWQR